jgi:hypothetical protein
MIGRMNLPGIFIMVNKNVQFALHLRTYSQLTGPNVLAAFA